MFTIVKTVFEEFRMQKFKFEHLVYIQRPVMDVRM